MEKDGKRQPPDEKRRIPDTNRKSSEEKQGIPPQEKKYRIPERKPGYTPPVEKKYRLPREQTPGFRETGAVPRRERRDLHRADPSDKEKYPDSERAPKRDDISQKNRDDPVKAPAPDDRRDSSKKTGASVTKGIKPALFTRPSHLDLDDLRLSPHYRYYRTGAVIIGILFLLFFSFLSWNWYQETIGGTGSDGSGSSDIMINPDPALPEPTEGVSTGIIPSFSIDEVIGEYNAIEKNMTAIEVRLRVDPSNSPVSLNPDEYVITIQVNEDDPVPLATPEKTTLYPGTSKTLGWDISSLQVGRNDRITLIMKPKIGEEIEGVRSIPEDYSGGPLYPS